ncbi:MAG TPA: hypothetical protein DCR44_02070 [Acholeplasmatales bacterium]|nr:hypothetical protein [Acholeplasmatales bacterium]
MLKIRCRFIVLILFLFTLMACTPTGIAVPKDRMDAPQGLSITGSTLEWQAVDGARKYDVYANGEKVDTVTGIAYDIGAPIVRTLYYLVTKGTLSIDESLPSISVAFVPGSATEVDQILSILISRDYEEPYDGFPEELVRRGMTAAEFQTLLDGFEDFQDVMSTTSDPLLINAALVELFAAIPNFEAVIAGVFKFIPTRLDDKIKDAERVITYYETTYPVATRTAKIDAVIAKLEAALAVDQAYATLLAEDRDRIIATLAAVADSLVTAHAALSGDLFTDLIGMIEDTDANAAELVLVKDEVVAVLLESMPSVDDLTMLYRLVFDLSAAALGDRADDATIGYANDFAAYVHAEYQLGLAYLGSLDVAYFEQLTAWEEDGASAQLLYARTLSLVARYQRSFQTAHADQFDDLDDLFDDDQRFAFMRVHTTLALSVLGQTAGTYVTDSDGIHLEALLAAMTSAQFSASAEAAAIFDDALADYFADADANFVELFVLRLGFAGGLFLRNTATDVAYANETEFVLARERASCAFWKEWFRFLGIMSDQLSDEALLSLTTLFGEAVPGDSLSVEIELDPVYADAFDIAFDAALAETNGDAAALIRSLAAYVNDTDLFDGLDDLVQSIHTHDVAAYGADYLASYSYDTTYKSYRVAIYGADRIAGFLTQTVSSDCAEAIQIYVAVATTAIVRAGTGWTTFQIEQQSDGWIDWIDDLADAALAIKDLNPDALTYQELVALEAYLELLESTPF